MYPPRAGALAVIVHMRARAVLLQLLRLGNLLHAYMARIGFACKFQAWPDRLIGPRVRTSPLAIRG